jgi:hypothetical protein
MALITSLFDARLRADHRDLGHLYRVPSQRADRQRLVSRDQLVARLVLGDCR